MTVRYVMKLPDKYSIDDIDLPIGTMVEPMPDKTEFVLAKRLYELLDNSDKLKGLQNDYKKLISDHVAVMYKLTIYMDEQRSKKNYEVSDFIRDVLKNEKGRENSD